MVLSNLTANTFIIILLITVISKKIPAGREKISPFKNLWPYARDIYQIPEVKEYTYFDIYKKYYQTSPHLKPLWRNVHGLVAKGPNPSGWEKPADREHLSKDPDHKFLRS